MTAPALHSTQAVAAPVRGSLGDVQQCEVYRYTLPPKRWKIVQESAIMSVQSAQAMGAPTG